MPDIVRFMDEDDLVELADVLVLSSFKTDTKEDTFGDWRGRSCMLLTKWQDSLGKGQAAEKLCEGLSDIGRKGLAFLLQRRGRFNQH